MSMPFPIRGYLPPNTIVPDRWDLFIPYFNRLYEDIAYSMNFKTEKYFPFSITNSPQNIIFIPQFGSYLICVSGIDEGLPCITASLCKASQNSAGTIAVLGSQAGNIAPWSGSTLTITSTATNFQIRHSVSGQIGDFNVQIIGTQG